MNPIRILASVLVVMTTMSSAYAQEDSFISTLWNKSANEYKIGDRFSFKVIPKLKSYIYVFYIDHKDHLLALYPGQVLNRQSFTKESPLTVSSITKGVLKIDSHRGYLLTVAIKDDVTGRKIRDFVLGHEDFNLLAPFDPHLDITGKQLIDRFKMLKADHPQQFHFMVEEAPRASK